MKQYKNILLVAPHSKQIVSQAAELLTSSQAKLTMMAIAPKLESTSLATQSGKEIDLQSLLESELQSELVEYATPLKQEGKRVTTIVVAADHSFLEVIKLVVQQEHDLVMMPTDGGSSIRDQLFGTLSMHLMRKCPSAVWVVKPGKRRKPRNVFAAVDPDPENTERDRLNVEILNRAATIAQNSMAKLHVVHAWNALDGVVARGRRWMSRPEIRLYNEKIAEVHRNRLTQLLERFDDLSPVVHMLEGQPGAVITETISRQQGDLLVMGTVCRTGIPGFFIGNTAETILNRVGCSVLTVKPQGFVSPVVV